MLAAERQEQNLKDELADAQAQYAEGIYSELKIFGEANYWVPAKTKVKVINPPKELKILEFDELYEFFGDDLKPFLKLVFLGSADDNCHVIELKRRMDEKAHELSCQKAEEALS